MALSRLQLGSIPKTGTEANLQMMDDPKYADLKITNSTHKREWLVHRAIVCARCSFFEVCLRNTFQESQANIIDLPEDDPVHIQYLLRYLYTINLAAAASCLAELKVERSFGIPNAPKVYSTTDAFALFSLADRLGLHEMKCHWQNDLTTKALALESDFKSGASSDLREERRKMMVSFVEKAYSCENPGIDQIRAAALKKMEQMPARESSFGLISGKKSYHITVLGDLIKAKPQFGMDLVMSLARKKNNGPVIELLGYSGLRDMLLVDTDAMLKLVDSLALSSGT